MRSNPSASGAGVAIGEDGQVAAAQVRRFPCPKCGATVAYDPSYGTVRCQFCGTPVSAEGTVDESAPGDKLAGDVAVSDQDWVAAIYTETGHAWALPQGVALKCEGCGATVTLGPAQVSGRCVYCGSPQLVRVAAATMGELREPDGMIPFAVGKSAVIERVQEWLAAQARKLGVPDDLARLSTMQAGTPVYVPFWTFYIEGNVEWSGYIRPDDGISPVGMDGAANLGMTALGLFMGDADIAARGIASMASSKWGNENLVYSTGWSVVSLYDTPVPATQSLSGEHLGKLEFDTKAAVPYREELLASWPAEVYSVSLGDASLTARERATKMVDRDIEMQTGRQVNADAGAPALRVDRTGLTVMSYKLLLLPVWVVSYVYEGESYRAVVNGQTGAVEGDAPRTDGLLGKVFGR
jgi:DNA-directed RNA polymerase subunit RPC12/RpoP